MFAKLTRTVIAKGLKIVGSVTAEGLVEVMVRLTANFTARPSSSLAGPVNGIVAAERAGCGWKSQVHPRR
jgi:hypothetical protein